MVIEKIQVVDNRADSSFLLLTENGKKEAMQTAQFPICVIC